MLKRSMNKKTVRKRTQALAPLAGKCCEQCGASNDLQRHHRTYVDTDYEILCRKCHVKRHVDTDTWGGRKARRPRPCVICGRVFLPPPRNKRLTCSEPCRVERLSESFAKLSKRRREEWLKMPPTHCSKGHLYSSDTMRVVDRPGRPNIHCRACGRERAQARYQARRLIHNYTGAER